MPLRPRKPCRHPGCTALTRSRYCPTHEKAHAWGGPTSQRPNARQRGYGRRHDVMRARVLREQPLCEACLAEGVTRPATAADHIIPKAEGGTDARSNYQALCNTHHARKTTLEASRGRQRARARGR